jgi:hypothetical protein
MPASTPSIGTNGPNEKQSVSQAQANRHPDQFIISS